MSSGITNFYFTDVYIAGMFTQTVEVIMPYTNSSLTYLIQNATTAATGEAYHDTDPGDPCSIQFSVAGTGIVGGTVDIYVSNTDGAYILAGTISASGSGSASDAMTITTPWAYKKAVLTSVFGLNAAANVIMAK